MSDLTVVERAKGRPLRRAERRIDVVYLTRLLDQQKRELTAAIRLEIRRAVLRSLTLGRPLRLEPSERMRRVLDRLYRAGRREALRELERAGYTPARSMEEARPLEPRLSSVWRRLRIGLRRLEPRVNQALVELDLGELTAAAVATAVMRTPGGPDLASLLVSPALFLGMGDTFEENQDLVDAWEYTAVLDAGTCEECEALDGTTYPSWAAIQEVLPGGGPNPQCYGGDRCRCRAVPQ